MGSRSSRKSCSRMSPIAMLPSQSQPESCRIWTKQWPDRVSTPVGNRQTNDTSLIIPASDLTSFSPRASQQFISNSTTFLTSITGSGRTNSTIFNNITHTGSPSPRTRPSFSIFTDRNSRCNLSSSPTVRQIQGRPKSGPNDRNKFGFLTLTESRTFSSSGCSIPNCK